MLSSRTDAANLIEIDNILVEYGRVEIWLVMNALLCVCIDVPLKSERVL